MVMGKKKGSQPKAATSSPTASSSGEKRIDPDDKQELTFQELQNKYKGKYNKSQVDYYWRNDCKPVTASPKAAPAQAPAAAKSEKHSAAPAIAKPEAPATAKPEAPAAPKAAQKEKSDDDDEDDDMPPLLEATTAKAAQKEETKALQKEESDDDDMPPLQPTASKAPQKEDSENDDMPPLQPTNLKAPAETKPSKAQDDSDDDMPPVMETKASRPSPKAENKENESQFSNGYPRQMENKIVAPPPKIVEDKPKIYEERFLDEGPKVYRIGQGVFFKKTGDDPKRGQLMKSCRPAGSLVFCTGRRWQGRMGGIWAELDGRREAGWALVKGPGFGVSGAVLEDAAAGGTGYLVLKFFHPAKQLERPIVELLLRRTANFEEVRAKLSTLTGMKFGQIVIAKRMPSDSPNGFGKLTFDYLPSTDILWDQNTVEESGFSDGHTVPWTYLGDFGKDMDLSLTAPHVLDNSPFVIP